MSRTNGEMRLPWPLHLAEQAEEYLLSTKITTVTELAVNGDCF
ncbi:hypothetical protein [Candidatus Protofrankia californiensis]|nr:hypothetical protein [Candidatus Protofrankia californiensis]